MVIKTKCPKCGRERSSKVAGKPLGGTAGQTLDHVFELECIECEPGPVEATVNAADPTRVDVKWTSRLPLVTVEDHELLAESMWHAMEEALMAYAPTRPPTMVTMLALTVYSALKAYQPHVDDQKAREAAAAFAGKQYANPKPRDGGPRQS